MSNVCRAYVEVCEHATEYGYCRLTTCAKHPQTIATNYTTSTIDTNNDVVEVVRCKDCDFWDSGCRWCDLWGDTQEYDNGYCSYGKRKDDE